MNKKLKRRDKTTLPRRTEKLRSSSVQRQGYRRQETREKLKMISRESKKSSSRRIWKRRNVKCVKKDCKRHTKR